MVIPGQSVIKQHGVGGLLGDEALVPALARHHWASTIWLARKVETPR
jgi:hypothetical protein